MQELTITVKAILEAHKNGSAFSLLLKVIDSFKYPTMNVFYKYDVWQVIQDGIIESDPAKFTK